MTYFHLFILYLKIGFFGFGGGYAMLALIQNEVVVRHQWISNGEFTEIVAISQMAPGPIAINSATYIGYVVTGNIWGSLIATLAVCLPTLTIMLLVTRFYMRLRNNLYIQSAMKGMQPMIIAMIVTAAFILLTPETFVDTASWIILGIAFIASVRKVNPIFLIVLSGIAGYLIYGL